MPIVANKNTRKLHRTYEHGASCEADNLDSARAAGHVSEVEDHEAEALLLTAGYEWCSRCKEDDEEDILSARRAAGAAPAPHAGIDCKEEDDDAVSD